MRKWILSTLIVSTFACSIAVSGAAAKKTAKPAAKKAQANVETVQLAGDNGVLGKVYSIRKGDPLYFRLKSAEFSTSQLVIGENTIIPKANEKLLVLHFTVQNPGKSESFVRWDSLRFTAVDSVNLNHEAENFWGDEKNHSNVEIKLKPAQKIDAYCGILVPAKGVVPKLIVMSSDDNDGPILRYDLRDKVSPLKAPVADPSDSTNATALEKVKAEFNTSYSYANFDINVEKYGYISDAIDDNAPDEDNRYMVFTLLAKNKSRENQLLRFDTVDAVLNSTDGESLEYGGMILANANRSFGKEIAPDGEMQVRIYFNVNKDSTPKTLELREGESRAYEFTIK